MRETFPWLSNIAARFQQYKFKGIVFHYIPTSGATSGTTNTALGSVMMQTSYRSNDDAPLSKVELLNEYWSSEAAPCSSFAHPIECAPEESVSRMHYVRTGNVPSGDNVLLYDLGTTYVAVSGNPATGNTVGDLWVTYEVELSKPVLDSNVTNSTSYWSAEYDAPLTGSVFGITPDSPTKVNPKSNYTPLVGSNTFTVTAGAVGTYTFFVVREGTSLTGLGAPAATISGGSFSDSMPNGTGDWWTWNSSTQIGIYGGFNVTDPTADVVITLTGMTFTGGTMSATSFILYRVGDVI